MMPKSSFFKTHLKSAIFVLAGLAFWQGLGCQAPAQLRVSDTLSLTRLAEGVYVHTSMLPTAQFGLVPCNGLVYVRHGKALIFDTPADGPQTEQLLDYLRQKLNATPTMLIVNHFHDDCLAGLPVIHAQGIRSYAHPRSIELAAAAGLPVPQESFGGDVFRFEHEGRSVECRFPGPGHSPDNTVAYLEAEGVLFGGCLVKALGAGKGNLADADTGRWAASVAKVKAAYPAVRHVVPGHGQAGDAALLDYTMALFGEK